MKMRMTRTGLRRRKGRVRAERIAMTRGRRRKKVTIAITSAANRIQSSGPLDPRHLL
jgi:hypothetical protein